jgi:hypothetical protein
MTKWKLYWKGGFRPPIAAGEVDASDAVLLVLQFLGIVFVAAFGVLCWVFPWGASDVPSIVGTVMQTVGLLCVIGAGLYALWASAWFGAGFGSAAGWLHLIALGACFYVIRTLALRYWGF